MSFIFLLLDTGIFLVLFYIVSDSTIRTNILHSFLLLVTVVKSTGLKCHLYFYSLVPEFFLCYSITYFMLYNFHALKFIFFCSLYFSTKRRFSNLLWNFTKFVLRHQWKEGREKRHALQSCLEYSWHLLLSYGKKIRCYSMSNNNSNNSECLNRIKLPTIVPLLLSMFVL